MFRGKDSIGFRRSDLWVPGIKEGALGGGIKKVMGFLYNTSLSIQKLRGTSGCGSRKAFVDLDYMGCEAYALLLTLLFIYYYFVSDRSGRGFSILCQGIRVSIWLPSGRSFQDRTL